MVRAKALWAAAPSSQSPRLDSKSGVLSTGLRLQIFLLPITCGTSQSELGQNSILLQSLLESSTLFWHFARPSQPRQTSAGDCAVYCESRLGVYFQSFALANATLNDDATTYECQCFHVKVGALKIRNSTENALIYYDKNCFELAC